MGGSTEGWGARQMPPQMFHGSTCIVAWLLLVRGVYSYHYQFQESRLANPCSGWSKFWWQYILHGISVYFSCYPSSQIVSVSSSSHRGQPSDKKKPEQESYFFNIRGSPKICTSTPPLFSIWSCFRFLMYSSPFLLYTLFLDLSSSIRFFNPQAKYSLAEIGWRTMSFSVLTILSCQMNRLNILIYISFSLYICTILGYNM